MKVLDVDLFQEGLQRNITMLTRLCTEIETIHRTVEGLVQMEEQLKGEGGNAIRSFYKECHLPFLQFFQLFSERYLQVLHQMEAALSSLEPDSSGYILETFLEGELEQGLIQIGQLTASLTDEANSIMDQVSDIVGLPHLDDSGVQEGVISSKRKRDDTISQLYEFDATQTSTLQAIEQDIQTMETWLLDLEGMFDSGLTDIHFQTEKWGALTSKNNLKTDLLYRTPSIAGLSTILDIESQMTTMLQIFLAGAGPIQFGYGGFINIQSPFVGTDMIALSCPRPEGNGTEQENVNQNPFVKSFHSFKGIAQDFWDGVDTRREKSLDSKYDFINYMTFGVTDGILSGAKERKDKMFDSKTDFANYATFGFSGMVKEAVSPEESFSKEHWLNSFGTAGSIFGVGKLVTTPVKKSGTATVVSKAIDEVKDVTEGTIKGLESKGYRPNLSERTMTKEEWLVLNRRGRIETNYPKPIIPEKNYDIVKSKSEYYTTEGDINWPPNRGLLGEPDSMTVLPGTIIDRFGYEGGTFVSPYGVPYEMRALAPETFLKPYNVYVITKPIKVQAGRIAPWFDEPGLGIQYEFNQSVGNLIEQGVLRRVEK